MRKYSGVLVLAFLCQILMAQPPAQLPAGFKPIQSGKWPLERKLYTICPPGHSLWYYYNNKRTIWKGIKYYSGTDYDPRQEVIFFRKDSILSPTHSFLAMVMVNWGNEKIKEKPKNKEQFKNLVEGIVLENYRELKYTKSEFSEDKKFGEWCIRHDIESEDPKAENKGLNPFLILRMIGYVFIYPKDNNDWIYVMFSERSNPKELDPKYFGEAEKFFQCLVLK